MDKLFVPNTRTRRKYMVSVSIFSVIVIAAFYLEGFIFDFISIALLPTIVMSLVGFLWVSRFKYRVSSDGLTIVRPILGDIKYPADTLGEPVISYSRLAGRHVAIPSTMQRYGRTAVTIPAQDSDGLQDALKQIT